MPTQSASVADSTHEQLLKVAIDLVQTRGFHGFSYRDLAETVGIRTASIHYHFPTKADLGRAVVERHRRDNAAFFARVESESPRPKRRLQKYVEAFRLCYGDGTNMCLGGMMAMDAPLLPEEVVAEIKSCYSDHEQWIAGVLRDGLIAGEFQFEEPPAAVAKVLFDALEGSLLASRAFRDPRRMDNSVGWVLRKIQA